MFCGCGLAHFPCKNISLTKVVKLLWYLCKLKIKKHMEPLQTKQLELFIASSATVQVSGGWVMSLINSVPSLMQQHTERLEKHGIKNVKMDQFYSQQAFLLALKEIYESSLKLSAKRVSATIGLSGKALAKTSKVPSIIGIPQLLKQMPSIYSSNHRGGYPGSIKISSFDENKKTLVMEFNTPYPKEFLEGMLNGFFSVYRTSDDVHQLSMKMENNIYTIIY